MITQFIRATLCTSLAFGISGVAVAQYGPGQPPVNQVAMFPEGSGCFFAEVLNCYNIVPANELPQCPSSGCTPIPPKPGQPQTLHWKCDRDLELRDPTNGVVSQLHLLTQGTYGNLAGTVTQHVCGQHYICKCATATWENYLAWEADNNVKPPCTPGVTLLGGGGGIPYSSQSLSETPCIGTGTITDPPPTGGRP